MMAVKKNFPFFESYLTIWVPLGIAVGIALGRLSPQVAVKLDSLAPYYVSVPIAICMFFMLYPIMVKIDFSRVLKVTKNPEPIILSAVIGWAIKPFIKFLLATHVALPLVGRFLTLS